MEATNPTHPSPAVVDRDVTDSTRTVDVNVVEPLLQWFEGQARGFLESHEPDRMAGLDQSVAALRRHLAHRNDRGTFCFLGNSGIGKSTLLNALAAGDTQLLPAGGIGPLTAQATQVHFSAVPEFSVRYHGAQKLQQLRFALEMQHRRTTSASAAVPEVLEGTAGVDDDPPAPERIELLLRQARLLITGNQFADASLTYVADALRLAVGSAPCWGETIRPEDAVRIEGLRRALSVAREGAVHQRVQGDDRQAFVSDLRDHSAGYLSPLIESIEVGWPSELLKSGVTLVDLPGVGIDQDAYVEVTRRFIGERALGVVLVVDKSGPSEAAVRMLRESGYWQRLVGSSDDATSDPCSLTIAVTRVDDVANSEYDSTSRDSGTRPPSRREIYGRLVGEFQGRMRQQITDQLSRLEVSDNEDVRAALTLAAQTILEGLEIHPVSAPQYVQNVRPIDPDDDDAPRPFLRGIDATGIPGLQAALVASMERQRQDRERRLNLLAQNFATEVLGSLRLVEARWRADEMAAAEADRLAEALETFVAPKRSEQENRRGAFRSYLNDAVPSRIGELIHEAAEVARKDINAYLRDLHEVPWQTLRAAVRRGGSYSGSREINLPLELVLRFQEPVVAMWSRRLLREIRDRTSEHATALAGLVDELCAWAETSSGAQLKKRALDHQRAVVAARAAQVRNVGEEAIDDLRQAVKGELSLAIAIRIVAACDDFVRRGNACGVGVKDRMLGLFRRLADEASVQARDAATELLRKRFASVRDEIATAATSWGDPLQQTADMIVERHDRRVRRAMEQKRAEVLSALDNLFTQCPVDSAA